jgi:putative transcriptional regulator, XRE family
MADHRNSNFSTLVLLTLKDYRLERNIHQGLLAQAIGKTPSAWTKIENGQSPLTVDGLMGACFALQLWPSHVITIVERLTSLFSSMGFYFHSVSLGENEDELLPLMLAYYNSKGYETLKSRPFDQVSVSAVGNPFSPAVIPTVVRYCCDLEFRKWIDDGAPSL